jgi:pyroglutamyl-peptidase
MPVAPILVTGFEPYGGHRRNPSFEAMQALDGRVIDGVAIVGRGLPVSMARLKPAIAELLDGSEFAAIIGLGLQPGAPAIHLERNAANLADFDIADTIPSPRRSSRRHSARRRTSTGWPPAAIP